MNSKHSWVAWELTLELLSQVTMCKVDIGVQLWDNNKLPTSELQS